VQEFRPASVIAADTELAQRLRSDDPAAVRSLVDRYASAVVVSALPAVGREAAPDVALDIFVVAAERPIHPGDDFAPWLAEIVVERAGAIDEQRWEIAMAISAIDPAARAALREHHVNGTVEIDDDLARHELRIQRRLSHVGEPDEVVAMLADPDVWGVVDAGFVERVVEAVVGKPAAADDNREKRSVDVSRVTRGLRPVLLGLAGAVAVLFVAIVALSAASGSPEQPDFTVELTPTGALVDVEGGEITVTERDAGTQIDIDAITLPRRAGGLYYEGRVVLADGNDISAGTFSEGDGVTLWSGVALDEAIAFRVVVGDIENASVDDVVLKADLPRS
jgi:hypothetical protein